MLIVTDEYTDFIFTDDLHRVFISYCHKEKLSPSTKGELTKAMQQWCPGAEKTRIRPEDAEGQPIKSALAAWRYVKLKQERQIELGASEK